MTARATVRRMGVTLLAGGVALSLIGCGSSLTPPPATVAAKTLSPAGTAAGSDAPAATAAATATASAPATTAAIACAAQPSGIVGWWPADKDASDAIGTNHGTPHGGDTLVDGQVGLAFSFSGSGQYVEVPSGAALQLKTGITIEGWVYAAGALDPYAGIAGTWDDNTGANRTYLLWVQGGRVEFVVSPDGQSYQRAGDPAALATDRWTHVAASYDGTTIRMYVDGAEVGMMAMAGSMATNARPFTIGRTDGGSVGQPNYWRGSIDELSVYDRAISAQDIAAIYAAGSAGKCRS